MATKKKPAAKKKKAKKLSPTEALLVSLKKSMDNLVNVLDDLEAAVNKFEDTGGDAEVEEDEGLGTRWGCE